MDDKKNNDFDDIILEKSNKNEKIKKILLRVIALVILFLVVMIVMRLINSDETREDNILPSEPTSLQASGESDGGGFENLPIVQDELEDQFDLLRKQIQNDANESAGTTQGTAVVEENFTMPPIAPPTAALEEQIPKTEAQQTEQPVKTAPLKTERPKPAPRTEVKASPKPSDTKELFKDVNATPLHASGLPLGIYVQIFSVNNLDQKSKELAAVKAKGYTYKLYKTTVGGKEITKILIGPFAKDKIAAELAKIRQELAKDAFSFELK